MFVQTHPRANLYYELVGISVVDYGRAADRGGICRHWPYTALIGPYALYPTLGLVLLYGLYVGFQPSTISAVLEFLYDTRIVKQIIGVLNAVPLLAEFIAALIGTMVVISFIGAIYGIIGGLLPTVYGFALGFDMFGESIKAFIPVLLGFGFTLGVIATALITVPAIIGGLFAGVGTQYLFSIASESIAPFPSLAEILRSAGLPNLVAEFIYTIGVILQSPPLLGVTVIVAGLAIGGRVVLAQVS